MKVLLVDTEVSGHHISYIKSLYRCINRSGKATIVIPEHIDDKEFQPNDMVAVPRHNGHLLSYIKWLNTIEKVADSISPDIVHFLYGDDFYRFFGFYIKHINHKYPVVLTCHHIRRSRLRDISMKMIGRSVSRIVVHTSSLVDTLSDLKVFNTKHIEYPQFYSDNYLPIEKARKILGINMLKGKILLALGGTRRDKGLDILLQALKRIENDFLLIIAGKEEDFTLEYIEELTKEYRDKVITKLVYLKENEMNAYVCACDIIVLPYRKQFDGASGPLGQGVWANKEVVGPSHGSLGRIIKENHLGLTFETENIESLAHTIDTALNEPWMCDEKYKSYKETLSPFRFNSEYISLYSELKND